MKMLKYFGAAALVAGVAVVSAMAADTSTYQLKNRLRVEYDDNVYETHNDKTDSLKVIEEVEFLANLNFEQTYFGLRYRPTFVWWEDRDPDSEDFHNDLDVVFAHKFTPRLTLNLKDTFRAAEQAKEIDRGGVVREKDDYIYNVADGSLNYLVSPETRLDLGGRYTLLRYDRNEVSKTDDYDIYAGGLTLRHELGSDATVLGEYRIENAEYELDARSSDSQYVGAGLEKVFSPNLLGNIRGGAQFKTFNDDSIDDNTSPYVDGALTYLPSPRTRLTAGAGYSLFEPDVTSYANQERTVSYISLAHDLTARVSLYAAASYEIGQYNADESILPAGTVISSGGGEKGNDIVVADGDEKVSQLSARAAYKLNRSNWLELGWQYLTLNSDLREDFDRNQIELGWRTEL